MPLHTPRETPGFQKWKAFVAGNPAETAHVPAGYWLLDVLGVLFGKADRQIAAAAGGGARFVLQRSNFLFVPCGGAI
jgi:hypothetical protein